MTLSILQSITCFANQTAYITLTKQAVGPITYNTPYELKTIQHLLPNLKIKKELSMTEGESFEVLVAYNQNKPLLTIVPNQQTLENKKLLCISFISNGIKNSLNATIGSRYADIYKDFATPRCIAGLEEMSGSVICRAPNAKNILYVFAGKWPGPDGTIPPLAILKEWTIKQITWLASAQYPIESYQLCRAFNFK